MAKARGELHRLRRRNPDAKIVVIGCGARYQPEHFAAADYVNHLPAELITGVPAEEHQGKTTDFPLVSPHGFIPRGRSRALLRIQNGCDQYCSYCIVPFLRGTSKSVPTEECVETTRKIIQRGVSEIVLTGTNIALWGRDLTSAGSLLDLLKALIPHLGDARLRLSSLEPPLISAELIEWCLAQPQICDHFHIAMQSGSNRLLEQMNREPPADDFYPFLRGVKLRHPEVSLGADVIAGLPGETETDFEATLQLLSEVPFSYLHVFPYSERPGTEAAQMEPLPTEERLARAAKLRVLDRKLRRRFIRHNSDKIHDVVIINNKRDRLEGLTSNYLRVAFPFDFAPPKARFQSKIYSSELAVNIQTS